MVGGVLRHLRSLRLLKRDGGFIHTLVSLTSILSVANLTVSYTLQLEEAENERMHLLTFMQIAKPSMLQRLLIFGAQGCVQAVIATKFCLTLPANLSQSVLQPFLP